MTKNEIIEKVQEKFEGLVLNKNWGEIGLFYNPENKLSKGVYLLTFKEKDGANDKASNVDREGVFRLNLGISKETFIKMFGETPKRPKAGKTINMEYDFTELNTIIPHPVYGWMSWICVLNPSKKTFEKLMLLIEEGYNLAVKKYEKKIIKHSNK
ncbi:DUF6194 family protein [Kordia sp.]|uniref:DUF6194 family protein n=1 Tax=Kordia sp. TaxID=1965332 RepID=UPI003B59FFEB